ncbi:MAG: hypothetical protein ABH834_03255 [Candidatus Altiarchaeota archaeon]
MPRRRQVPGQPSLFVEGVAAIKQQRIDKLEDIAEKAGCAEQLDRVMSAVHDYSRDYHPHLEEDLLDVLERSSKLDSHSFEVIVDSLDFAAAELKLPRAMRTVPGPSKDLRNHIATMNQLRRLGLPLTEETLGVDEKHFQRWDPELKAYDPARTDSANNATARPFYYRLLAYNSAVSVPGNDIVDCDGRPLHPFSLDIAFLAFRDHLDSFAAMHKHFQERFPPPDDARLDAFLLELPKHTDEYIKGNGPDGRPFLTREQKLARWYSRVKAVGTQIKRKPPERQGSFTFMNE